MCLVEDKIEVVNLVRRMMVEQWQWLAKNEMTLNVNRSPATLVSSSHKRNHFGKEVSFSLEEEKTTSIIDFDEFPSFSCIIVTLWRHMLEVIDPHHPPLGFFGWCCLSTKCVKELILRLTDGWGTRESGVSEYNLGPILQKPVNADSFVSFQILYNS